MFDTNNSYTNTKPHNIICSGGSITVHGLYVRGLTDYTFECFLYANIFKLFNVLCFQISDLSFYGIFLQYLYLKHFLAHNSGFPGYNLHI